MLMLFLSIMAGCSRSSKSIDPASGVTSLDTSDLALKKVIPGMQAQNLPNVMVMENGYIRPVPCYAWRMPDRPDDFEVLPINVHWGNKGWKPNRGYAWTDPDDDQDLCVKRHNRDWFDRWLNIRERRIKRR